jgi:hypothetical protein
MNSVRGYATAVNLLDGKLLVIGGYNGSANLNSAEMLTEDGWESNIPSLPFTIRDHCMVTVKSTTVMAIGGRQNGYFYSGKSFYFTVGEEAWTEGPELKYKRGFYGCGKIRRDKERQEMSIIVAGGFDGYGLTSVEILDEGSNEWQTGPELPLDIWYPQMVEDPNGGVVLIRGYSELVGRLDTLYQLLHGGQDALWTKMEQKLSIERASHAAMLVPDNIVDCS